eukprot:TRINITY_DN7259_c0_g1_i1.p1 TRINITY_DN7259_c0_g1~~TRINITY_DN7259_c0_g1_i1.p1  ORF type:complete len:280 (+),score=31.24 TRINITY_DN7259_c0_g1_i1:871-1710(+)
MAKKGEEVDDFAAFEEALEDQVADSPSVSREGSATGLSHAWAGTLFSIVCAEASKIRLIDAPAALISLLGKAIREHYRKGVIDEKEHSQGVWQYKLSGSPWLVQTVETCVLVCGILRALYCEGFRLHASTNPYPGSAEKQTWVFEAGYVSLPSVPEFVCLAAHGTDRVRLINAPTGLAGRLQRVITTVWQPGLQKQKEKGDEDGLNWTEYKLRGNPWEGDQFTLSRRLVCAMLAFMAKRGYRVYTSMGMYTWIFVPPSLSPGTSPVLSAVPYLATGRSA